MLPSLTNSHTCFLVLLFSCASINFYQLDIFLTRCSSKAKSIVKDPTHPSHSLFQFLPSGRRYRSIRACSARLLNSFFPQAVRALNSHHTAPLWNPKLTPPTPPPNHITGKNCETFISVQFKCATHRWAGLHKPPVATHSPLHALDTFTHHCVSIIPQKTDCNIWL